MTKPLLFFIGVIFSFSLLLAESREYNFDEQIYLGDKHLYTDYELAKSHFKNAIDAARRIDYKIGEVDATIKLALCYIWMGSQEDYSIASKKILEARNLAESINYKRGVGLSYLREGVLCYNTNKYNLALNHYFQSLNYLKEVNDTLNLIGTYQNMALIHSDLAQYQKSIQLEKKALKLAESSENNLKRVILNYNIGVTYLDQNKTDSTLIYLNKGNSLLEYLEPNDRENQQLYYLVSFAETYLRNKQIDKVKNISLQIIDILNKKEYLKRGYSYSEALSVIGQCWLELGNYDDAKTSFLELEEIFKESPYLSYEVKLMRNFSRLYEKEGNYKKANSYLKKWKTLSDSLRKITVIKSINFYDAQFESQKKDQAIIEKNLKIDEQENQFLKAITAKNLMIIVLITLLVLTLVSFGFFRYKNILKNKEIEDLKNKNKINNLTSLIDGEERERERLAKELHDGVLGELAAIKHQISLYETVSDHQKKESMTTIDSSIRQIRNISHNLAPPIILDANLIDAIKYYCNRLSSYECKIFFQSFGEYRKLNIKIETSIYRVVQELVSNIVKHSNATNAIVEIGFRNDKMRIIVEDNGIGMDQGSLNKGIGLSNINSRIKFLGADMDVESNERGTTFYIELDIKDHLSE